MRTTVTPTVAVPTSPPVSVTAAVMRCGPGLSAFVMLAPVPSVPSRSEVQTRRAPSGPSSRSLAVPLNVTGLPARTTAASAGAVIATSGSVSAAGGGRTVTVTRSIAWVPALPVTEAVTVWEPTDSGVVSVAPVPSRPWTLDVHVTPAPRSLPSASTAVAWSVIGSPSKNVAPVGGWTMCAIGLGALATVRTSVGFCPLVAAAEL